MASLFARSLELVLAAHAAVDTIHDRVSTNLATLATWWIRAHVLDSEQARADLDAVLAGDVDRQVHEAAVDTWDAGFQRAVLSIRAAVERDERLHPGAAEVVLALLDELAATALSESPEDAVEHLRKRLHAALFEAASADLDGQEAFDRLVDAAVSVLATHPVPSR